MPADETQIQMEVESDSSCDIDKSIEEVRKTINLGIKCLVATERLEVELSQYPF